MKPRRKKHIAKLVKPLFSPADFYKDFQDVTVAKARLAELEKNKMEEIQSKRGWIGYELPRCSWASHWKPSEAVSNYRSWPGEAPGWIIQVVDGSGYNTCMLRRKAVLEMPGVEWENMMRSVKALRDSYPVLDDSDHYEVQDEAQQAEWAETYREEFRKELSDKFSDVLVTLPYGERIQDKFESMLWDDRLLDKFFHVIVSNDVRGRLDELWTEADDGDWSCDVTEVVNSISTQTIVDHVWPEDSRQMKFKFMRAESLVREMLNDDLMVAVDAPLAHEIVDSLLEDEGPHTYSCVMINLPEDLANQVMAWGKLQVKDEDVVVDEKGGKGRETEPHVTVLYGLLDDKPSDLLEQVFENTAPFDIKLGPCSVFRNDGHDVLKLEVISPFLHALNRNVCSVAAYENDFPDYKPHVTIAYVQPGTADRLEGASPWDDPVKLGQTTLGQDGVFTAKEVIFSSKNGQKTVHTLGQSKITAKAVKEALPHHLGLFKDATGRNPADEDELNSWVWDMVREYNRDQNRGVGDDLGDKFDVWLQNKSAVAHAMSDWEPSVFEKFFGRKPDCDGELAKWIREASQAYYQSTGRISGLRSWLEGYLTESSDEDMASFVAGSGALDTPSRVSHATIRRILGRHVIDRVEIWKGDNWGSEGNIRIVYKENGRADSPRKVWEDSWACYDVLKWALRNWRNLYGVRLIVNGQEAGTVSYRNPALAE